MQEYLDDLLHRNVAWIRHPGMRRIPRTKDSARRTVPWRAYFKCLSQCLDTDHLFGKLFKSHVHSTVLSVRTNRFHFKYQGLASPSSLQECGERGLAVCFPVKVGAPCTAVGCCRSTESGNRMQSCLQVLPRLVRSSSKSCSPSVQIHRAEGSYSNILYTACVQGVHTEVHEGKGESFYPSTSLLVSRN